jgi:hypothetical protein
MNFPTPLFALLAARQANDSPADAGRVALVSMVAKPPILGLLLAVVMAKQAAPAPAVPTTNTNRSFNTTTRSAKTSQGALVLNQVAPETELHSFLPSFIQFSRNHALEFARDHRLKVQFVEESGGHSKKVVQQHPEPGAGWPLGREVTLHLG